MPPKNKKAAATTAPGGSPSKADLTSAGVPRKHAQTILANYDLETSSRREELQRTMQSMLVDLKRRLENEAQRLPASIQHMSVKDFFDLYEGDVRKAAEGVVSGQVKEQAKKDQEQVEAQSPKKRKRPADVPPSPALPKSKRFQPAATASSSKAPATSRTPKPKRKPKKNETVQAYSMNGSPLGTIPATTSTVPTGAFTFSLPMDSFTKGLRAELNGIAMSDEEKSKLEQRLLSFMKEFKG